jgi:hypothetical protein
MVSGNPKALKRSDCTSKREMYLLEFAEEVRKRHPNLHLILTGGLRTKSGMSSALDSGACDLIGIARASVVTPDFSRSVAGVDSNGDHEGTQVEMLLVKVKEPWYLPWLPNPQARTALWGGLQTEFYWAMMSDLVNSILVMHGVYTCSLLFIKLDVLVKLMQLVSLNVFRLE